MSKRITASGKLTIQSDTTVTGQGADSRQLTLGPGGASTGERFVEETASNAPEVATTGDPGDAFESLSAVDSLSEVQMLYVRTNAQIVLRLYALAATLQATAGSFPTGFGGGETSTITIDGTAVVVTFDVADQTAIQVAARINAAAALAGLVTPRASVVNGQLKITGVSTAVASSGVGQITADTGAPSVTLGLAPATSPTSVDAQGQDVTVDGLFISEFPRTGTRTLTKVQVSGQATLDVVAAGRA